MNLVYITANFPYGGGESFFIPELEMLRYKIDGSVVVIPRDAKGVRRSDWMPRAKNVLVLRQKLISTQIVGAAVLLSLLRPIQVIKALLPLLRGKPSHVLRNLAVFPKGLWVALNVGRLDIDHIHAHWGGTTSTMAMVAAAVSGVPWSFTCHRWDIYDNNLLAMKADRAQFARFISERGRVDAAKLGVDTSKTIVVAMGVAGIPPARKRQERSKFVIICPANLVEVKGHKYLLEATAALVRRGIPIALKIAGDGPLRPELTCLAHSLNLNEHVEFLGQVEQGKLLKAYGDGDVDLVVLPSVDLGAGQHEGIPVSLMEAMSFGIPVISTATGSINELLPPGLGLTVSDKDAPALAVAIDSLLSDPVRYETVAEQLKRTIRERWLIEHSVETMILHMALAQALV